MKHLQKIIPVLLLLALCGCTRNNSDIGKLFGLWHLTSIQTERTDLPEYPGNIYWGFQNTTIEMKEVADHHDVYTTFGSYCIEDNTMFLSFPDKDFAPNRFTGLPRECELQIIKLTGKEMILSYSEPATIYTFRKW
ncbi:MAG: lipocalin-like domain-containing protein [Prevotella sp.]|nr:lipocalin-like domain-containing protein [Prevotella sp.]MCM1075448.1 lipocalin-like domain-containing protein [Ruminococcus sp.]